MMGNLKHFPVKTGIRHGEYGQRAFILKIKDFGFEVQYSSCCVCGWDLASIDLAHVVPARDGGLYTWDNIIPLCPNHHRVFDKGELKDYELENVQSFLWSISNKITPF